MSKYSLTSKEALRAYIVRTVPGLLILLDLESRRLYGSDFVELCLSDLNRAEKVLIKVCNGDRDLAKRIMRMLMKGFKLT